MNVFSFVQKEQQCKDPEAAPSLAHEEHSGQGRANRGELGEKQVLGAGLAFSLGARERYWAVLNKQRCNLIYLLARSFCDE